MFIVMREEYLTYVKEYVNRLEPYMDQLEKQGLWRKVKLQAKLMTGSLLASCKYIISMIFDMI